MKLLSELGLIKELNERQKNGQDEVSLCIKGRWGSRNYRTIYGVRGEIVTELDDNTLLCIFPVGELLDAVLKNLPKIKLEN